MGSTLPRHLRHFLKAQDERVLYRPHGILNKDISLRDLKKTLRARATSCSVSWISIVVTLAHLREPCQYHGIINQAQRTMHADHQGNHPHLQKVLLSDWRNSIIKHFEWSLSYTITEVLINPFQSDHVMEVDEEATISTNKDGQTSTSSSKPIIVIKSAKIMFK